MTGNPRFSVVYRIIGNRDHAEARARAVATEQSVEMPLAAIFDKRILGEVVGRVVAIESESESSHLATIELAEETLDGSAGQFLNMLIGNTSFWRDTELVNFTPPAGAFDGPQLGIAGLRRLAGADKRALTLSNLKPQGLAAGELADLARRLALGGLDLIKDDHGLADQPAAPLAQRVAAISGAVERASERTGERTLYLPHLTGNLDELRRGIDLIRAHRLAGVLITPMLVGLPAFHTLTRENPDLAFMTHPAFAGRAPIGFVPLLGKLFRLFGADAVVFPTHGCRFDIPRPWSLGVAEAQRRPWLAVKPTLPVPAGGLGYDNIAALLTDYGHDIAVFLGGTLLASGERLTEDSRRFVAAVRGLSQPAASAPARSATRSSPSSMPAEIRTRPSEMPSRRR